MRGPRAAQTRQHPPAFLAPDPQWPPPALPVHGLQAHVLRHDGYRLLAPPTFPAAVRRGRRLAHGRRQHRRDRPLPGKVGAHAARLNDERLRDFELIDLQADELRTVALGKKKPIWVYTTLEVSSRLWPVSRVGRRGYRATLTLLCDLAARALPDAVPLIATDGYRYYKPAIKKTFGGLCYFGQVIKARRKDRVVKVERQYVSCTRREMEEALERSEDPSTLNASFIERFNLVIRQGSAYLTRRAASQARSVSRLAEHLEMFRCFYNLLRPHGALRFGLTKQPRGYAAEEVLVAASNDRRERKTPRSS